MWKRWTVLTVALGALATTVNAERTTEIFIPIGASPGLSGRHTSIGTVEAINPTADTITVAERSGTRVIHCTEGTKFWLDRSQRREANQVGALADCRPGSRIEVKYVDNDKDEAIAEWIKIEVSGSN